MRKIACLALASLMLMVLLTPMVLAQNGPKIDVLRYQVILNPSFDFYPPHEMLWRWIDVLTQMSEPEDIETLADQGFTVTYTPGFHICFIGFNIRPDQSYRRPEINFWPLADINFRHALAHSLNKQGILAATSGYVKSPLDSMVPPSLSAWYNPATPEHPFNLGDPFGNTVYNPETGENEDTCSILRYGGYEFVDADYSGDVTREDYWLCPNGDPLPEMEILFPEGNNDMQKHVLILAWRNDFLSIGLRGTSSNGWSGLSLNGETGYWFWPYTSSVYRDADFDLFIVNFKLNRLPDYLYDWFHSSQDSLSSPWAYNAFGVNDPTLDLLLETVKFSLDHTEKEQACHGVQTWLASPTIPQALPTIPFYCKTYYDAFNPDLRGIVKSPGYGAGEGGCVALREPDGPSPTAWTYTNIRWAPGTERWEDVDGDTVQESVVIWCLGDEPESYNPLYAGTAAAWEVLDRMFDPLITVHTFNHEDRPWLAEDWEITLTPTGMNVTYYLRDDVNWQDGYQFTAYDAEFSLEFIRDYHVPKYRPAWQNILDVEVIDPFTFTVQSNATSQFLIYDWAVLAALLPPQIWDRTWPSDQAVLDYDPTAHAYGSDMAPSYAPGPWAGQVPTNLFGTGPFIFQFYDPLDMYCDLWANENYFLTTQEIDDMLAEMFHEVGDVNYDGEVDVLDLVLISFSYGYYEGEPEYNPDADLNQDGVVDTRDLATAAFFLGQQKEYP